MKFLRQALLILLSTFILVGCSTADDKPTDVMVEEAVILELRKTGIPERWVKAGVRGINPNFDIIKIVEWGKYNQERRGAPVKVHITGTATLKIPFARKEEIRPFDAVGEFYFYKDDYDKWQSKFNRPGIFGKQLSFEEKEQKAKEMLKKYGIKVK